VKRLGWQFDEGLGGRAEARDETQVGQARRPREQERSEDLAAYIPQLAGSRLSNYGTAGPADGVSLIRYS